MSGTPPIGPDGGMARVLVVLDLPLLVKLIMLTLKHGIWIVRTATTLEQVAASAIALIRMYSSSMALDGSRMLHQVRTRTVAGAPH